MNGHADAATGHHLGQASDVAARERKQGSVQGNGARTDVLAHLRCHLAGQRHRYSRQLLRQDLADAQLV